MRHLILCSAVLIAMTAPAQADVPRVATDIAPVHSLVSQVMQGLGAPDLIVSQGASPHSYALRPSEARALSGADIVIWMGPGLAPWLEGPVETLAADALHIDLTQQPGTHLIAFRTDEAFDGHDHGHDHDKDHGHAAEGHGAAFDAHAWLDPENAQVWLLAIAEQLAGLDPDNAELYRANAQTAAAGLAETEQSIRTTIEAATVKPFIVFHDAYHYFEASFGVEAVAAISLADADAASAGRLAEVRDQVAETGATCALVEPMANVGLIEAVTTEAGIKVVTADPLGAGISLGPDFYEALLLHLADAVQSCEAE
jgi:zinc transport system substrate-binding protein